MVGANPLVSHGSVLTRAADPRAAARDRRPRRPRGGGRPAPVRDRAPVRARAGHARHRRVAAALDAARDLRRGARRTATSSLRTPTARTRSRDMARPFAPEETAARTGVPAETRPRARARDRRRRRRRRLRAHRLVPRPLRHARRVPDRRAERRDRQPRRPGGAVFGRPAIALDDVGEQARARQLRQGALALRRLPRRDRQPAGVADAAGDRRRRASSSPRAVRLGGQPGAVGARRRRARARARRARPVRLARLLRQRDQPPRRLRPAQPDLLRARRPAARVPRLLHDAVHPVHGRGRAAGGRGARGVGGDRRDREADRDRRRSRVKPLRAARPPAGPAPDAAPDRSTCCCARARGRPVRPAARRAEHRKIAREPHGIVLAEHIPTGVLREKVRHKGSRVQLAPEAIAAEVGAAVERQRRPTRVPAAADRPARAPLAQLVDAQLAAPDARRARARAARPPARRRGARPRRRRRGARWPRSRARSWCP